jgi:hypothetical protein
MAVVLTRVIFWVRCAGNAAEPVIRRNDVQTRSEDYCSRLERSANQVIVYQDGNEAPRRGRPQRHRFCPECGINRAQLFVSEKSGSGVI